MLYPLQDMVLIETIPLEEVTKAGLVLVKDSAKHVPHQDGYLVEIGAGCKDITKAIPKGTKVMFRNFQEVKRWTEDDTGKEYVIIREEWLHGAYDYSPNVKV